MCVQANVLASSTFAEVARFLVENSLGEHWRLIRAKEKGKTSPKRRFVRAAGRGGGAAESCLGSPARRPARRPLLRAAAGAAAGVVAVALPASLSSVDRPESPSKRRRPDGRDLGEGAVPSFTIGAGSFSDDADERMRAEL